MSHTHAPGEEHSHSHGPPQQQQQMFAPPPDPKMQALIDQDFAPTPLSLSEDTHTAVCAAHSLEKCESCDVDFVNLNRLAKILAANPNLLCPPPANVVSGKLSQMVTATKDEGNTLFKAGQHSQAITRYTMAASVAVQRPPWENNQVLREELSTVVSNRSAAYYESRDFISALADAETVIAVRRNWSKGHFRKAKALFAMGRLQEAADAIQLGLSFEPNNNELSGFLAEIEKSGKKGKEVKVEKQEATSTPVAA
ncbi:hypothetical protein BD779DRAFT_1612779 [Infundibulicybe gibba]|nr:hypothetical protein BD779DRAFT_1612779 [Infundibulicybe gibba]